MHQPGFNQGRERQQSFLLQLPANHYGLSWSKLNLKKAEVL
jgi:hypothetical protein